jgi:hypothetical protein
MSDYKPGGDHMSDYKPGGDHMSDSEASIGSSSAPKPCVDEISDFKSDVFRPTECKSGANHPSDYRPDNTCNLTKVTGTSSSVFKRKGKASGLPFKKRKLDTDNEFSVTNVEAETNLTFDPAGHKWQDEKCNVFGVKVRNYHKPIIQKTVSIHARPTKTAPMRGDGNCLFRTMSYMVSGVQSYHADIRQTLVHYMLTNYELFEGYLDESLTGYLNKTEMWQCGKWGTDNEIRAFATLLSTNVFVYCRYGDRKCWIKYPPMDSEANSNMYMLHHNDHYEPVLDVEHECVVVIDDTRFSKPPYLRIGKHVPNKFTKFVSSDVLNAALVNNYNDERILENMPTCPDTIYVKAFKDKPYDIPGTGHIAKQMDSNIFNLLCDEVDFASHWL